MHDSKLLQTHSLFSKEELKSLDAFLQSPYFMDKTVPTEVYALFQYINSYAANPDHPHLEKAKAFAFIFPKSRFIPGKMNKLMSALLGKINEFIGVHFSEFNDQLQQKLSLVNFYQQRNASKYANHHLEKLKKEHEKIKFQDDDYFFTGFQIAGEEFKRNKLLRQLENTIDVPRTLYDLDVFYLLTKLEYACYVLSLDRFRKPLDTTQMTDFLDQVKIAIGQKRLMEIPLVKVYFHTYEMLKSSDEKNELFHELQRLMEFYANDIPLRTMKLLSSIIRNFGIRKYNLGAHQSMDAVFRLHKNHLEKGYLNHEKGIVPSTFKNMVTMGLRTKNYDWVFKFMEEYKDKLEGTIFPDDVYHYNLAHYYFEKKEFDQAIDLLTNQYEDRYYKIAAKRLELKIYYESRSNILSSKIDAFKLYIFRLSNKEILAHKKKNNNSFVNALRQISNQKAISTEEKIKKLIAKIEKMSLISEKTWLLQKLNELL